MTIYSLTVAQYDASIQENGAFADQDTVIIVDSAESLDGLTAAAIAGMRVNGVDRIDSTDNLLRLDKAKFDELGVTMALTFDDQVTLADTASAINAFTGTEIFAMGSRGIDVLDAGGGSIVFGMLQALNLNSSQSLRMAEADHVTVRDTAENVGALLDGLTALDAKNVDVIDVTDDALTLNAARAHALAGTANLSMSADDMITVRDTAANLAALSADDIRQLGVKNVDFLDSSFGELILRVDQGVALTEAGALSVAAGNAISVKDTAANLASLTAQQILSLSDRNIDQLDLIDRSEALALTAAQVEALVATATLQVHWEVSVSLTDTGSNISGLLAGLTEDQLARLNPKGVDTIDAAGLGSIDLSITTLNRLRSSGVAFATDDTVTLRDSGAVFASLSWTQIVGFQSSHVDVLDSTTGTYVLNLLQAGALGSVTLAADDQVTVSDTAANIAALTPEQIAGLGDKGVWKVDAEDLAAQYAFSAEQTKALAATGSLSLAADDVVTLTDSGAGITAALAGLGAAQIGALAAKGIDAIDAAGAGAVNLSVAKFKALGAITLAADDAVTLVDTGAALARLTSAEIASLRGKGVDALNASNNRVSLSLAQFKALGTLHLSTGDTFEVRGTTRADTVLGHANKEAIFGVAGNDRLNGGAGNDTLSGGSGKDILTGGSGYDRFRFDAVLNAKTNLDTVTDWRNGYDKFLLDDAVFKKMGHGTTTGRTLSSKFFAFGARTDKDDYLSYNSKTGNVSYDADGVGTKYKAIDFLHLQKGLSAKTLNAADFLIV